MKRRGWALLFTAPLIEGMVTLPGHVRRAAVVRRDVTVVAASPSSRAVVVKQESLAAAPYIAASGPDRARVSELNAFLMRIVGHIGN